MTIDCVKLITILGPTASGKTSIATRLAATLGGDIISADSRQVYRGLDIGTGKDLAEYEVDGQFIPYHAIDIVDPMGDYNVFRFQQLVLDLVPTLVTQGRQPILCGGTGFYLSSVLQGKRLIEVSEDQAFRQWAYRQPLSVLADQLRQFKALHNDTDIESHDRVVRALEIAKAESNLDPSERELPLWEHLVFGLMWKPDELRLRIRQRLVSRLEEGLIDEVTNLRKAGVTDQRLDRFGLEYRFITQYLTGMIDYEDMVERLFLAICDFAKRQRTWFRRMERQGVPIQWIEGARADQILDLVS